MPRILVTSESTDINAPTVLLQERVRAEEMTSAHFSARLLERLGWAVGDAERVEREPDPAP